MPSLREALGQPVLRPRGQVVAGIGIQEGAVGRVIGPLRPRVRGLRRGGGCGRRGGGQGGAQLSDLMPLRLHLPGQGAQLRLQVGYLCGHVGQSGRGLGRRMRGARRTGLQGLALEHGAVEGVYVPLGLVQALLGRIGQGGAGCGHAYQADQDGYAACHGPSPPPSRRGG